MEDVYASKLLPFYFSKISNTFKPCEHWEVKLYLKYGYRIEYRNGGIVKDYLL